MRREFQAVQPLLHFGGRHRANVHGKRLGETVQPCGQVAGVTRRFAARFFGCNQFGYHVGNALARHLASSVPFEKMRRLDDAVLAENLNSLRNDARRHFQGNSGWTQQFNRPPVTGRLTVPHGCRRRVTAGKLAGDFFGFLAGAAVIGEAAQPAHAAGVVGQLVNCPLLFSVCG